MIYCICPRSILTIDTDNEEIHFSVLKGLTFLCLCNLSFSSERISKFFRNPHIACRLWDQKMRIYSKNISIRTILVTISYPTEILTLLEISKIGFLKKGFFSFIKKLRNFPFPLEICIPMRTLLIWNFADTVLEEVSEFFETCLVLTYIIWMHETNG